MFTESKNKEASNVPLLMTPSNHGTEQISELDGRNNRNQAIRGSKTAIDQSVTSDGHLRLIQKLQEDKIMRKRREDERRQKTLEKYTKQVEEKQKIEKEVKEKQAEEKF